jgi:hypothetical protein
MGAEVFLFGFEFGGFFAEGGCGGVEGVELGVDGGGVDFFLFVFLIDDVSYVLDNE